MTDTDTNADADADADAVTRSSNTRSYAFRSVPSSPGRSFLSKASSPSSPVSNCQYILASTKHKSGETYLSTGSKYCSECRLLRNILFLDPYHDQDQLKGSSTKFYRLNLSRTILVNVHCTMYILQGVFLTPPPKSSKYKNVRLG